VPISRCATLALGLLLALFVSVMLALPCVGMASGYLTGIGDEQASMFASPLYQQLGTRIARDIVPYDVVDRPADLSTFELWDQAAQADGVQPLIAFYHSRVSPLRMPSVAGYRQEITKFIKLFPNIKSYQPWNEANRGTVTGQLKSPSASLSAQYYLALKGACRGCQVVGLDVLDGSNIKPTIVYIHQFEKALRAAHQSLPTIWGLHDYSDTNRFRSSGTKAVLKAVPGEVWLTETGGIVHFGSSFTNVHGKGLIRAAKALRYMFSLAASNRRIKRLYIFQWTGSIPSVRFDAGLTEPDGAPRAGYLVVCQHLLGAHSSKCSPSSAPATPTPSSSTPFGYGTPVALHFLPTIPGALTDDVQILSP
jgi:hypothetical protein